MMQCQPNDGIRLLGNRYFILKIATPLFGIKTKMLHPVKENTFLIRVLKFRKRYSHRTKCADDHTEH